MSCTPMQKSDGRRRRSSVPGARCSASRGEMLEREGEEGDALWIERDDLSRMGLDTWSEADRAYVQEFGSLYFGRRVEIRGNEVDCCGLRVPLL